MLPAYLADSLILLGAAVVLVPFFQRLGLGTVLGFLFAGGLVGPSALGLISNVGEIRHFAELGVVFLLFIIGIELKPSRLWLMRRWVFGLGSAQVVATGVVLACVGWVLGLGPGVAVLVGFGLALSSTAFVVRILSEQRALTSRYGRSTFAILLLQDLAVVPLMALIPLLGEAQMSLGAELGLAIIEALVILALVILGGRLLLQPALRRIAETGDSDIFAASAVLLVLGTAALVAAAGLSLALGAFLAGLLIADSEFRHQILADIQPFRGFLLGLFFMAVGMSVNLEILGEKPLVFLGLLAGLLAIKTTLLTLLARLFKRTMRESLASGLLLAQSGEFAFVLFGVAFTQRVIDEALFHQLLLLVALSMVATPPLARLAARIVSGQTSGDGAKENESFGHPDEQDEKSVVIAGFGRVGRRIAGMLGNAGISYVAIERQAEAVAAARGAGYSVFFGDSSNDKVLTAAGVAAARLVVVTIDAPDAARHLVSELHRRYPELPIIVRGRDRKECHALRALGAVEAVSEAFESSLQLGAEAMRRIGATEEVVRDQIEEQRQIYGDMGNDKS